MPITAPIATNSPYSHINNTNNTHTLQIGRREIKKDPLQSWRGSLVMNKLGRDYCPVMSYQAVWLYLLPYRLRSLFRLHAGQEATLQCRCVVQLELLLVAFGQTLSFSKITKHIGDDHHHQFGTILTIAF